MPAIRDRLHRALSVVYGIEPYVILKDIWGLPDREVERIALWMADALIDAALHQSKKPERKTSVPARKSPARKKMTPAWYDAQYNNRARIPGHPAILAHWAQASADALARHPDMVEDRYGSHPRERLDVFPAKAAGSPVFVYFHGGYWRALDKRDQSFVAPPFVAAGALAVLADYSLCPAVSIEHIVLQTVQALRWVHRHAARWGGDPDRIVVAGHSAGGHLATMLLACRWQAVDADLPADLVKAALSISGLYELEPLRHAPFVAADLGLTAESAGKLSPAAMPAPGGQLVTVVGGDESEEFLRQADLIGRAWGPDTVAATERTPGRNHMDVLHELPDPRSRTHALALGLLGLRR